jgi:hypothetical protein
MNSQESSSTLNLLQQAFASLPALLWSCPYGIASSLCHARPSISSDQVVVSFLVPQLPLPSQQQELLTKAALNGLLLAPQQFTLLSFSQHATSCASYFCALGVSELGLLAGEWGTLDGRPVLCSQGLDVVLCDSARKRLLWQDLKNLRSRLGQE